MSSKKESESSFVRSRELAALGAAMLVFGISASRFLADGVFCGGPVACLGVVTIFLAAAVYLKETGQIKNLF